MLNFAKPLADHLYYEDGSSMEGIKLRRMWRIAINRIVNQETVFNVY